MRHLLLILAGICLARPAPAQDASVKADAQQWIIEAIGTETTAPERIHVMMKMETDPSQAAQATRSGEKRLQEFLAAVDALKIPDLTHRVVNNVITPATGGYMPGVVYSRNIVFTLPVSSERDRIVAKLEDLGARHNSHCVTCIGSG
jgi:hypothetical protein